MNNQKKSSPANLSKVSKYLGIGIANALALGAGVGAGLHKISAGVGAGLVLGIALGTTLVEQNKKESERK